MEYQKHVLSYEDYTALRASVGWTNRSEVQTRRALERSFETITARENGRAVGMARLVGDGLYLILADVAVRPNCQGRGIGRRMVELLLDAARAATPAGSQVSIQLISAADREPFYEKLGFCTIPNESCGHGMQLLVRSET